MKIQKTTNLILNDNGAVNVEIYKRTNFCREVMNIQKILNFQVKS